jgi:hypothetical protein
MLEGKSAKALGLALLVAVGVMAVSASAAQAKWLLLRNQVSVLELKLTGEVLLTEMLVGSIGYKLHCSKGVSSTTLSLNASHTVLTSTATTIFQGCVIKECEKVCTVRSPGLAAGEIKATASGEWKMEGEKVYADLSGAEISVLEITGALCPYSEYDGVIMNGTLTLTLDEPLKDQTTHLALLDDNGKLFLGAENAILHGELLAEGVHEPAILTHFKEASNASWGLHLVGL